MAAQAEVPGASLPLALSWKTKLNSRLTKLRHPLPLIGRQKDRQQHPAECDELLADVGLAFKKPP
jgi:hypothetical protein